MSEQRLIGTYQIVEKIGSGGMATVYKAHQPRVDRFVAIKVLHQMFLDDKNFVTRFQREAQIAGKLDHPNIVPIYDFDLQDQQPYLVMKFIEGQTLKERMRDNALTLDEIRHVMRSICDALTYAHHQGILHRDIKPSNIMISDDGAVYLTDFGLARMVHQGESTLSIDTMLGTPHYISPEQAQSEPIDSRTDIYAVGIILYELMTGRLPFTGDSAFAIVHQQIFSAPPSPSQLNPDIKPAVEAVLLKALMKNPHDRYRTANDLFRAFEDALRESDTVMLDASRAERAQSVAQSISRHTPRGGRYQPAQIPDEERFFVNSDGSRSVIVPVIDANAVIPDLTVKEWLDVVIARVQNMMDDLRQHSQNRSLEEYVGDAYYQIEGQVNRVANAVQNQWTGSEVYETHHEIEEKSKRKANSVYPVNIASPVREQPRQTDWGMTEKAIKRRRRSNWIQWILFLSHAGLFITTVILLYFFQPMVSETILAALTEEAPEIATSIGTSPENVISTLGLLANIPVWLMVIWGWGLTTLMPHGISVLDKTLDFRHHQRLNRTHQRMAYIYGEDWQDIADPKVYHQINKKVAKSAGRRVSFIGHALVGIVSMLIVSAIQPQVDPFIAQIITNLGEQFQPLAQWSVVILAFILISIAIHFIVYLVENILDNDRREMKIQEAIQKELQKSQSNHKLKNDQNYAPIRLSEDGEFTDSFIHEINKNNEDNPKISQTVL